MTHPKVTLHAVARIDTYIHDAASWSDKLTVVQMFADQKEALTEVERLNALNGGKGSIYFMTIARIRISELENILNDLRLRTTKTRNGATQQ